MQKLILADDMIIRLYDLKYSPDFIGNVFHCSRYSIIRVLKENNINIRTLKEARQNRLNDEDMNKQVGKSVSEYYKEHKIIRSDEEKKQISEKLMGHKISDETKKKISDTLTGRKLTEEHKKNIGIASAKRTYIRNDEYKEKLRIARAKQKIPFKDTLPERIIQVLLFDNNIAFEKHKIIKNLLSEKYKFHQFDIVIPNLNIIIEIQGCYFHGCKKCFSIFNEMQLNAIKRDTKIRKEVKNSEWRLIELWEHDILIWDKDKNFDILNIL